MFISGQLMLSELSLLKISCSVFVSSTRLIYIGFPQMLLEVFVAGSQDHSDYPLQMPGNPPFLEVAGPEHLPKPLTSPSPATHCRRHHPHFSETPFKCLGLLSFQ